MATTQEINSQLHLKPFFDGTDYAVWKICMEAYLKFQNLWNCIKKEYQLPTTKDSDGNPILQEEDKYTTFEIMP